MKKRLKGLLTKRKLFSFAGKLLLVIVGAVILLSLVGTVAHAAGLVDDTVNADNLYSQYPLENYQLDFYVDNSWGWLPWNWLDGIGNRYSTGFTVLLISSGLSACTYLMLRGTSSSRRMNWTSSTIWRTVSVRAYRPLQG